MMREPDVLADIRAVRDDLAARHGGDARSLSRALIERSRIAGRVVVRYPARVPAPSKASRVPTPTVLSVPTSLESVAEAPTA